jgi:hypothetical protein
MEQVWLTALQGSQQTKRRYTEIGKRKLGRGVNIKKA